jgi:hypothetical protein
MVFSPGMLVEAAKKAGIKVPKNPNKFDEKKYPHFAIFCNAQLGRRLPYWSVVWDNADVVAKLTLKETKSITLPQLIKKGFQ